jgi:hypothetical protein
LFNPEFSPQIPGRHFLAAKPRLAGEPGEQELAKLAANGYRGIIFNATPASLGQHGLTGLEQAIRNALERAERANPAVRSRIYQSARNALDTGLRKQDIQDGEVIANQRQRLEATIQAIEDEELERLRMAARLEKMFIEATPFAPVEPQAAPFSPVAESVVQPADVIVPNRPVNRTPPAAADAQPQARQVPGDVEDGSLSSLSATRDGGGAPDWSRSKTSRKGKTAEPRGRRSTRVSRHEEEDPAWAEPATPEGKALSPRKRAAQRRRGSWVASLFVYCMLLGIIGFGGWWVYSTGMITAALHGDGNFDFIPKELQGEDFEPKTTLKVGVDPLRYFNSDWVDIFKPSDIAGVQPAAQAIVGDVSDSDGRAITIASSAPDQDGEVRIPLPAAIMESLAGKTSTLAVTLRVDGDTPSQIYIQCDFGVLGDCGRHRFTVSNERVDELIQIKLDGKSADGVAGYVVINSDLTGEGKAIRLYGIRVRPAS